MSTSKQPFSKDGPRPRAPEAPREAHIKNANSSARSWAQSLSHVQFFATPRTVAHQAPLSMGFSKKKYWSGVPFPPPGDLPNPGVEPMSPALQVDSLLSEPPQKPSLAPVLTSWIQNCAEWEGSVSLCYNKPCRRCSPGLNGVNTAFWGLGSPKSTLFA